MLRRDLLLDAEAPGKNGGGGDVGLHTAGRDLGAGRRRCARGDGEFGDSDVGDGLGGVERGGLIEAVVECVEQAVVEAEAAANCGFAVAPDVPREADARLGKKERVVLGERRAADDGLGLQNAVDEGVVGCAALGFIPAVGGFGAETGSELEARGQLDGVFEEGRAGKRCASRVRWAKERR